MNPRLLILLAAILTGITYAGAHQLEHRYVVLERV